MKAGAEVSFFPKGRADLASPVMNEKLAKLPQSYRGFGSGEEPDVYFAMPRDFSARLMTLQIGAAKGQRRRSFIQSIRMILTMMLETASDTIL